MNNSTPGVTSPSACRKSHRRDDDEMEEDGEEVRGGRGAVFFYIISSPISFEDFHIPHFPLFNSESGSRKFSVGAAAATHRR